MYVLAYENCVFDILRSDTNGRVNNTRGIGFFYQHQVYYKSDTYEWIQVIYIKLIDFPEHYDSIDVAEKLTAYPRLWGFSLAT